MNECNLVICDQEFRYANLLASNIRKREELAIKVYVCTKVEYVLMMMKEKQIHILVIDEQAFSKEPTQLLATQIFVLGAGAIKEQQTQGQVIQKYQNADEIIRIIFEAYTEKTKENLIRITRKENPKIIAVYSPIHRIGKTTFAMSFGSECAKRKKTLYVNLEEYAGFSESFEEGMNLGDLLYYAKQGNGNIGVRLQSAIKKKGDLDFLLPIPVARDLREVSLEEWQLLLEQIIENSSYERIVLDVGESIRDLFQVLELMDRVYMPVDKDEISQRKLQRYEQNVDCLGLEKLGRITSKFVMPENVEEYAKIRAKEEC